MSKICLCLTAKTLERNLEILNKYRKYADIAELRVDCLNANERFLIRRFPELARMPVILTIRRKIDGGYFTGGEGSRVNLLAGGLAFAEADSRMNFAYVDIEEDLEVPSIEEAARVFGTRIIRSCHKLDGVMDDIPAKIKSMQRSGDEIIKIAVAVKSSADVLSVLRASKEFTAQEKIFICMGREGISSRILAEKFGSFLTYSSALSETETPAAPGQLDVKELAELYRFRKITKETKVFGITGFPLKSTVSPYFFNKLFDFENVDAVYSPFPSDSASDLLTLADELDVRGLSVTVPHKETIMQGLSEYSAAVKSVGACNTVFRRNGIWVGENTDCAGFSDSLLAFIKRQNFKHLKITVIGAGGAARAVVAEIFRLGGKALVLNRTALKAKNIASLYNFQWAGLDEQGIERMAKYSDIIIQTTSVGMEGYENADPVKGYNFSGREAVMDLIYTPSETLFLRRAAAAGCRTLNGYDMVIRQACLQYSHFMGREVPNQFLERLNETGEKMWNKIRIG